jgi:GNAT superfamily N-acetyltransferase
MGGCWKPTTRVEDALTSDERTMAQIAESAEAEFMLALYNAAPEHVKSSLGMKASRVAGGVVCTMEHDPTGGVWSRALGHGFDRPLDNDVLDEILRAFREGRVASGVVQPSPLADPPEWPKQFASRGLTASRTWVKFLRRPSDLPASNTDLEIRRVEEQDAAAFATTYCRGFGMPSEGPFQQWFAALPTVPGWHCFGAWEANSVVASANLFIANDVGVLAGAATVEEARGRGAQGALMRARMALAAELGLRWVSTETGSETPEDPNPSLHNMRRLGFTELYERRNWIYRAETDVAAAG